MDTKPHHDESFRSVRQIAEAVARWSRENFGDQPSYRPLLGIVEEVGELCHAHLKGEQGIRLTPEQVVEKKVDAVGDIMIFLFDYCGREKIDPVDALFDTWLNIVQKRNWKPETQYVGSFPVFPVGEGDNPF